MSRYSIKNGEHSNERVIIHNETGIETTWDIPNEELHYLGLSPGEISVINNNQGYAVVINNPNEPYIHGFFIDDPNL